MKKILLSLAAVAALTVGFSGAAKADPHIGFGFSFGGYGAPGFGPGFGGFGPGPFRPAGFYGPGYGYGYHHWQRHGCVVRWVGHHHPRPVRICY